MLGPEGSFEALYGSALVVFGLFELVLIVEYAAEKLHGVEGLGVARPEGAPLGFQRFFEVKKGFFLQVVLSGFAKDPRKHFAYGERLGVVFSVVAEGEAQGIFKAAYGALGVAGFVEFVGNVECSVGFGFENFVEFEPHASGRSCVDRAWDEGSRAWVTCFWRKALAGF